MPLLNKTAVFGNYFPRDPWIGPDLWDHVKGSPDSSHFIFEINVGKGRIRYKTTPKLKF